MILAVCRDDTNGTLRIGQQQSSDSHQVFGNCYGIFGGTLPRLGAHENLFIIAHGAVTSDNGGPVIGDRDGNSPFYWSPAELWVGIQSIFPPDYRGNVYVSACNTADSTNGTCSFTELFESAMKHARPAAGRVYGHRGPIRGKIPLPNSSSWVPAA
jgi:hypothetical protein